MLLQPAWGGGREGGGGARGCSMYKINGAIDVPVVVLSCTTHCSTVWYYALILSVIMHCHAL